MMVNTFMKTEIFPSIGEEKFRTIANSAPFTMVIIRLEEGAQPTIRKNGTVADIHKA